MAEERCTLARDDSLDTFSRVASLPRPARLKDAAETDSVVLSASVHSADSASFFENRTKDEEDFVGGGNATASFSSPEEHPSDLVKYIRQRNALYSRRKYYKRKQELERLAEMKNQLEVRNEALRRDNAQLERAMQWIQRRTEEEMASVDVATRRQQALLLQRLWREEASPPLSQYTATAVAAAAVGNHPLACPGVFDDDDIHLGNLSRASELQRLLQGVSRSRSDQILPLSVRSSGLAPSHSTQPPHWDLSQVPMNVPQWWARHSSAIQTTAATWQQLLASLRDDRALAAAAWLDQERRRAEVEQLRQLLQQQQQQPSLDPSSFLLGPVSAPRAALSSSSDLFLRQLLQSKAQQQEHLARGRQL
jgi:hypothetical protein